MADSHVLPPTAAVNDSARDVAPSPKQLLQAVLRSVHAALVCEDMWTAASQCENGTCDATTQQLSNMHSDVYGALHASIAALAQADGAPPELVETGHLLENFFGADCLNSQLAQRDKLYAHLTAGYAPDPHVATLMQVLQLRFAQLTTAHLLPEDPLTASDIKTDPD